MTLTASIYRTYNSDNHDRIANIPEVRANVSLHLRQGDARLCFAELAERADDFVLLTDGADACSIFERNGPSVFHAHSLFGPSCRGRAAIEAGRRMLDWLWINTTVRIVTGSTPVELRAARWFNRQIGLISDGVEVLHGAYEDHAVEWFRAERPR